MDASDSPGAAGTPRKSLWRSASWCARSSPTSVHPGTATANTSTIAKNRPAPLHLPPLSIARCPRAWPLPAPADSSTSSPPASSLVVGDLSRVTDHIYLGGDAAARDRNLLRRHGITHILNCAGFACPDRFRGDLHYRTLWLRDHPGEDIASLLFGAFDFLEEVRTRGRALVHCSRGTSRSAAIVVAYLMWRRALTFEDALCVVRASRPAADPNPGFTAQLLHWQRRLIPSQPQDASPRVYRMAPHSPYDPLHLVPKAVEPVGTGELDSRGAFLVHTPATETGAVYLWVGAECEPAMAVSAGAAARQILRYERARGPIVTVEEGREPAEFWDALGCSMASDGAVLAAGGRKLEAYDLDFEIYRRALKGGPEKDAAASLKMGIATPRANTLVPDCGDYVHAAAPFGSPSSLSGGSVTPTSSESSTLFTFSPASSSSDWCISSPRSDLSYAELPSLSSPRLPLPSSVPSLIDHSGGIVPSALLQTQVVDADHPGDAEKDWPFSPYPLGEQDDDNPMDIDRASPSGKIGDATAALYQYLPSLQKVEMLHPGVLDSECVFLLLAPMRSSDCGEFKTLFVWVGRNYRITLSTDSHLSHGGYKEDGDGEAYFKKIGLKFLDQMALPIDIPVQVIGEDEEPEDFLNHFFTFHQIKERS